MAPDLRDSADAIAEVWYRFEEFGKATNPLSQASRLVELSNAVGNLITWHPNYDYEYGRIEGVYEDE